MKTCRSKKASRIPGRRWSATRFAQHIFCCKHTNNSDWLLHLSQSGSKVAQW